MEQRETDTWYESHKTAACVVGDTVSPLLTTQEKLMDSKLGLQGPEVLTKQHVTQYVVSFQTVTQGKYHLSFALPPLPKCYFLSQGPLWWTATLSKVLSSMICSIKGLLVGTSLLSSSLFLLVWASTPNAAIHIRGFLLKGTWGLPPILQRHASCHHWLQGWK